jgi:hypothetical protein
MNARNAAIEQARVYWLNQGLPVDTFTIVARQIPLPGSVWWVEAHTPDARYDLLAERVGKHIYRFEAQCPYGYTIYALHSGRETPLAVVEYAAQAKARMKLLQEELRYAHASLCFLPNPSEQWSQSMQQLLEGKGQIRESRLRQQAGLDDGISNLLSARVMEQLNTTPAVLYEPVGPYPHDILQLLETAIHEKSPHYFVHHRAETQAFLAGRMRANTCQPFGWVWSSGECLLLTPGDAMSQQMLFSIRRWKRKRYCFYFDGDHLHECASEAELKEYLGFDY